MQGLHILLRVVLRRHHLRYLWGGQVLVARHDGLPRLLPHWVLPVGDRTHGPHLPALLGGLRQVYRFDNVHGVHELAAARPGPHIMRRVLCSRDLR